MVCTARLCETEQDLSTMSMVFYRHFLLESMCLPVMIQNIPAKYSVFLNILAWFMCACALICASYTLLFKTTCVHIYTHTHVHTYPYVHNIYKCADYFLVFRLLLFLSTCRNHLSLQNGVVPLSGCGDVQRAWRWAAWLLLGLGCSGAPAHSPTCSRERESWRWSGLNGARGPSCLGVSVHVLVFFICAPFPVHL